MRYPYRARFALFVRFDVDSRPDSNLLPVQIKRR
jgi:hypothetical protein